MTGQHCCIAGLLRNLGASRCLKEWHFPSHLILCRLRGELLAAGERLNADGLRVLAVAVRQLPSVRAALAAAGFGGSCSSPVAPATPCVSANGASDAEAEAAAAAAAAGAAAADTSMGSAEIAAATAGDGSGDAPPDSCPAGSPAGASYSSDQEAEMTLIGFLAFLVSSHAAASKVGQLVATTHTAA